MEVQTANNGELLSGGSVLENAGTLTLDDNADLQPGDSNTADKVVNDAGATISYSGSSSSADAVIGLPLTDTGTINATAGTLYVDVAGGSGSPTLSGTGTIELTGTGSLPATATMSALNELIISGTLNVPASLGLGAASTQLAGTLSGPGTVTVPAGSAATLGVIPGWPGGSGW